MPNVLLRELQSDLGKCKILTLENVHTKKVRKNKLSSNEEITFIELETYCDNIFMKRTIPTVCFAHLGINPLT